LIGCDGRSVIFAHDLDQTVRNAEAAAARFRASVDHYIGQAGIDAPAGSAEPPAATWRHSDAPSPDLPADNLVGVIWATGFTADRSWLPVDALTAKGEPCHTRGVSAPPGLLSSASNGNTGDRRTPSMVLAGTRNIWPSTSWRGLPSEPREPGQNARSDRRRKCNGLFVERALRHERVGRGVAGREAGCIQCG
jgi:hypothetical protein